jgi:TfoX/Sxy family transcriptional regulator of competence genes
MAYEAELADRVRERLRGVDGVTELRMFGGWGVTIHGNMAVGVMGQDLIVRVGADAYDDALAKPGARPFDFTGRSMTGWVYVDGNAIVDNRTLTGWIKRGSSYAQSLPPKAGGGRKPRTSPRSR